MIENTMHMISQAQDLTRRAMFRRAAVLLREVISNQDASERARRTALSLAEGLAEKAERHRQTIAAAQEKRQREQARAAALRLEAALARAAAAPRQDRAEFNGHIMPTAPKAGRPMKPENVAALKAQAERARLHKEYLQDVQRLARQGMTAGAIARELGKPARTVRYTIQQMIKRNQLPAADK